MKECSTSTQPIPTLLDYQFVVVTHCLVCFGDESPSMLTLTSHGVLQVHIHAAFLLVLGGGMGDDRLRPTRMSLNTEKGH